MCLYRRPLAPLMLVGRLVEAGIAVQLAIHQQSPIPQIQPPVSALVNHHFPHQLRTAVLFLRLVVLQLPHPQPSPVSPAIATSMHRLRAEITV